MTRLEELKILLVENPTDNFITYACALELIKLNQVKEAILLLEQLLLRDQDYLAAYYQLGKFYEMNHEMKNASQTFTKGMEVAKKQNNQRTLNELSSALGLLDE